MANTANGLSINGQWREVASEPHCSLLEVLREELRFTGTKVGCNEGECGSCTVLLEGKPVLACLLLIGDAIGRDVVTIEGLSSGDALTGGGQPHPLQSHMVEGGGIQCGYCTPGIIMSAYALLQEQPDPTSEEVRQAIAGNICRCTGYVKIIDAVQRAAAEIRERS
jgi:carbon-monoxide dehydrogenase small subunit